MDYLDEFVGCTINRELTKIILQISQPYLITKMTQIFNEDMKSLINFNAPDIPYKEILHNQEIDTKISYDLQKRYRSGV